MIWHRPFTFETAKLNFKYKPEALALRQERKYAPEIEFSTYYLWEEMNNSQVNAEVLYVRNRHSVFYNATLILLYMLA